MEKNLKIQLGLQLQEQCRQSVGFFVLGYTGLTVEDSNILRKTLQKTGARVRVVKNHIAQKALEGMSIDIRSFLKGQTMFVFANKDMVSSAKVLRDILKQKENIHLKGGYVDGVVLSHKDVLVYADLPSQAELYAQLLYILNAPARQIARVINEVPTSLVRALKAIAEQKETQNA